MTLRSSALAAKDISDSLGKLPPQAIDLEEAVLGAALLERNGQIIMFEKLTREDFYYDTHAEIFGAMKALADEGKPVDLRSVRHELTRHGKIELIGGPVYLAELTSRVSSSAHIEHYCHILIEKRILRDLILLAGKMHQDAYNDDADAFKLLTEVSNWPQKVMESIKTGGERTIKEGIIELTRSITEYKEGETELTGIPTGYTNVDRVTSGWQEGNLIIIAGRPGMGKTTIALNLLRNPAVDFQMPVAIFSLEMTFRDLVNKFVSAETNIELRTITKKMFTPTDWVQFDHLSARLTNSPIFIDDTPAITISDFKIRARRLVERYKVKMIAIDYLQLMKGESIHKGNREQEISSITRSLKATAKELKIPIIALSQLSREVEKRGGDMIPRLSDLRESGSIEQDADIIIFPYRPGYYKFTGDNGGTFLEGVTKMIFAKNRNGGTDVEPILRGHLKTSKFTEIDSPYVKEAPVTTQFPAGLRKIDRQPESSLFHEETKQTIDDGAPF